MHLERKIEGLLWPVRNQLGNNKQPFLNWKIVHTYCCIGPQSYRQLYRYKALIFKYITYFSRGPLLVIVKQSFQHPWYLRKENLSLIICYLHWPKLKWGLTVKYMEEAFSSIHGSFNDCKHILRGIKANSHFTSALYQEPGSFNDCKHILRGIKANSHFTSALYQEPGRDLHKWS